MELVLELEAREVMRHDVLLAQGPYLPDQRQDFRHSGPIPTLVC
jgi:hypothetical protein